MPLKSIKINIFLFLILVNVDKKYFVVQDKENFQQQNAPGISNNIDPSVR